MNPRDSGKSSPTISPLIKENSPQGMYTVFGNARNEEKKSSEVNEEAKLSTVDPVKKK